MRRTKEQLAREVVGAVIAEMLRDEKSSAFWLGLSLEEQERLRTAWVERIWRIA